MTDQELQQLARKYAEQNPPQVQDRVLQENAIFLNATMVFEPFIRWLLRNHYIISRERVREMYNGFSKELEAERMMEQTPSHQANRYSLSGRKAVIEEIFGKETFKK